MRSLLVAVAATTAFSLPLAAIAADAVDSVPEVPQSSYVEPMPGAWEGAYIGVMGDYNWGRFANDPAQTGNAFGGAVYGGYNWQDDSLVYGLEGDIGYSGVENITGGTTSKQGANGSLRARMGVDLNPFMLYGTGGVAATSLSLDDGTNTDTKTLFGWTAGLGAETKITDSISARLEYRYTDFGLKNFNLGGSAVSSGYDEHSVKLGIGYHF